MARSKKKVKKKLHSFVFIPARMESTRFPGKPLALLAGMPMIEHVYRRASKARSITGAYLTTPNKEIVDFCNGRGIPVILTKKSHASAPDRVAEAIIHAEKMLGYRIDIAVMVQGDEPMIRPRVIDDLVRALERSPEISIANAVAPIRNKRELFDPNIVKALINQRGNIIWFFRQPSLRWNAALTTLNIWKQTGIIVFRPSFLKAFSSMPRSSIEKVESVDMFRLLEDGYCIKAVETTDLLYSVDTPADARHVSKLFKKDSLLA